ncbi:MAG: spheroidene monooxygenase [Bacteroidota bacterium]
MITTLTIVRYPKWLVWAGMMSMAVLRLPLWLNPNISFWKLMGSGKNGSFDKTPDLRQWALISVFKNDDVTHLQVQLQDIDHQKILKQQYGSFIRNWWLFFNCEIWTIVLNPIEGHGFWDGNEVFGQLEKNTAYEGPIAILTRATIRLNKMKSFWANVAPVANKMNDLEGFIGSYGIGEIPWKKQATFSLWESKIAMRNFAYKMKEHATVIQKTKKEDWYSEEMFVRFIPIASYGTLRGVNPLKRKPYLANN